MINIFRDKYYISEIAKKKKVSKQGIHYFIRKCKANNADTSWFNEYKKGEHNNGYYIYPKQFRIFWKDRVYRSSKFFNI